MQGFRGLGFAAWGLGLCMPYVVVTEAGGAGGQTDAAWTELFGLRL